MVVMSQMSTGWPYGNTPYTPSGATGRPATGSGPRQSAPFVTRTDALAAIDASAELGPSLRGDVVDAFVADVNAKLAADWQQRQYQQQLDEQHGSAERRARTRDLVITLAMAIPLTAIGGEAAGLIGLLVSWAGTAAVAVGLSLRRGTPKQNPGR